MTRKKIQAKLTEVISNLEDILKSEGKQTQAGSQLEFCIGRLRHCRDEMSSLASPDLNKVMEVVILLLKSLMIFVSK